MGRERGGGGGGREREINIAILEVGSCSLTLLGHTPYMTLLGHTPSLSSQDCSLSSLCREGGGWRVDGRRSVEADGGFTNWLAPQ